MMVFETEIFAGPFATLDDAWDAAEAACRELADVMGTDYPIPADWGSIVGRKLPRDRFLNPDKYATRYLTAPIVDERTGDIYLPVSSEMQRLAAGKTQLVNGRTVDVIVDGTLRTDVVVEPAPERVVSVQKVRVAKR